MPKLKERNPYPAWPIDVPVPGKPQGDRGWVYDGRNEDIMQDKYWKAPLYDIVCAYIESKIIVLAEL